MTNRGFKFYKDEIERATNASDLQYYKRYWADESRRMVSDRYRRQCIELSNLAGARLLDMYEYHGEGTA